MQRYIINELGSTVDDDMRRMEAIASASDLAWTLVRPSRLFEAPAASADGIAIDHIPIGSRPDHWADCLLRQALDDTLCARRSPSRRECQGVDAEVDLTGMRPHAGVSSTDRLRPADTMGTAMERPDHTTSGADDPVFTALWTAHRRRMLDLAFRMLLDLGDAEDAVQEAFTRLARTDIARIDDPEGWLVVVTSRLCLDRLRTRGRRPTDSLYVVDDPFDSDAVDPSDRATLVDNVTLAMHALLERLSPAERTSFVLHDVFQYPFEEVATIVGRSPSACRQLASRARRTLQTESAAGRFPVNSALQRQVSERFIETCMDGDLEGLLALLDPAVSGTGDIVPGVAVGADAVAPRILRYLGPPASPTLLHLPVGDRIGIVAMRDRRVLALVLLTIDNGLVVHVDALAGEGPRAAVSAVLGLP